ncbi:MAG: hypothetical protein ABSC26_06255 [Stellaceae bacterium]|jgi:hypothetical protein
MARIIAIAILAGLLSLAAPASESHAQSSSAAGGWTCPCPGGPQPLGKAPSCNAVCFGGGNAPAQLPPASAALIQNFGNMLGQMIRQQLEDQARQEQMQAAAWQAELDRIQARQDAEAEASKQRILGMIKGSEGLPNLQPKTSTGGTLAATSGNIGGGLQPKTGDAPADSGAAGTYASVAASSPAAQLTAAFYYSNLAATAPNDEEAATLSEAAFNTALGMPTDIVVPANTNLLPVSDATAAQIKTIRSDYFTASTNAQASARRLTEVEQRRGIAQGLLHQAQAQLAAAPQVERDNPNSELRQRFNEADTLAHVTENERDKAWYAREQAQAELVGRAGRADTFLNSFIKRYARYDSSHQPEKDAYLVGIRHGSDCLPPNAAGYCTNLNPALTTQCVENYTRGYKVGQILKENRLQTAYRIGEEDQVTHRPLTSPVHVQATGVCGVHWVEAYNSGYFHEPYTNIGR